MTDEAINVSYTNWRGETKVRRVLLSQVRFGTTDWHKEPTWLISAFDLDHPAQIWKEFDLAKCDFNRDYMPDEIKRLRWELQSYSQVGGDADRYAAIWREENPLSQKERSK